MTAGTALVFAGLYAGGGLWYPATGRDARAVLKRRTPAQFCDAGAQEEAIADAGSYPAALGD
jgi:hypothetical protein